MFICFFVMVFLLERRLGILRGGLWVHSLFGMQCFGRCGREGWIWNFDGAVGFLVVSGGDFGGG